MSSYYACALGLDGLLHTRQGDIAAGEQLLRACLKGLRQAQFEVLYRRFLGGLAEVLLAAGRFDESLAAIDEALELDHVPLSNWTPDALRIKGDLLLLLNSADTKPAEDYFHQSLDVARRQGALFWELRTTMSLGRLYHSQGRVHEARDLLKSVCARFTEGFATAELQSARRLLEEWSPAETCNGRS
jgi:predicted ATPase